MVEKLTLSEYRADRATRNTLRAAARALGLPPSVLASSSRGELRRLLRRARGRAEREWDSIGRRIDAIVALQDLLEEARR